MDIKFDDNYWHDSVIKNIIIDRSSPGQIDTITFDIDWYDKWLNKGDVWKYGETTSSERYSKDYLEREGVRIMPQFSGTQVEIKVAEKIQIYKYVMTHGSLPPGNKIFR